MSKFLLFWFLFLGVGAGTGGTLPNLEWVT
jgi:hypothetical protein